MNWQQFIALVSVKPLLEMCHVRGSFASNPSNHRVDARNERCGGGIDAAHNPIARQECAYNREIRGRKKSRLIAVLAYS